MAFWMMMSLHDEVQGNQSKLKEGKAKPKQNQRTTKGNQRKAKESHNEHQKKTMRKSGSKIGQFLI